MKVSCCQVIDMILWLTFPVADTLPLQSRYLLTWTFTYMCIVGYQHCGRNVWRGRRRMVEISRVRRDA